MMTSTLDGTSRRNFRGHDGKNSILSSNVLVLKFVEVLFDEGDVFDGFHEAPHSELFVALLLMALSNSFVLLFPDPEE